MKHMNWKNCYKDGLDSFAKRDFSKALFCFQNSITPGGGGELCVLKAVGNTLFRMRAFSLAKIYFNSYLLKNIYDVDVAASCVIANICDCNEKQAKQIILSFYNVYNNNLFIEMISKVVSYFYRHRECALDRVMVDILYDVKSQKSTENNRMCYILIQPLLDKDHLFVNKECRCHRIFIKQNFIYAYFMPFYEELLKKISYELENLNVKDIVLLSTSAGGFISLLLGHDIAEKFPNIKVTIHAFSPQTSIIDNNNLSHVMHYKVYKKIIGNVKALAAEAQNRSEIAKIYENKLENLSANIYVGEDAIVDVNEVKRVKDCDNIKVTTLNKFPFHDTLAIYRYDLPKLLLKMNGFKSLTLGDGRIQKNKYSAADCCKLKNSVKLSLNDILPFID